MKDQHDAAATIQREAYRTTQQTKKGRTMKTNQSGVKRIARLFTGLALAAGAFLPQLAVAAGPAPVALGEAAHFTILAGAAVTTTGGGIIDGDVGASPIAGSAIHLTAAQVNGTIYTVDNTGPAGSQMDPVMLTAAKGALTVAYNDAAGRTPVPTGPFLNPGAGNIGGLNLVPGLYKFTGKAYITGGDVTLTGGPDDVWIFQIATELIVGADGRSVILAGGAQARNVFWQVGTSATLGTFCSFKGTIMADQAIVMDTSSTMEGRALAFEAGVTFNGTGGSLPLNGQVITNFIPTNGAVFAATNQVGLSAQASSGLPVSFTVKSGPGAILGGTNLAFASTGIVKVVASQAGNEAYYPAPNVTNTFIVTPPLSAEPGALAINVTPNAGSWRLTVPAGYTGPTAGTGDLAAVSAVVGEYAITYGAVAGYVKPTNQTQLVIANVTSLFEGVYLLIDTNIAPPVVTATEGTYTNKVRISWDSVPDVTGYEIWKSRTNDPDTAERLVETPDYGAATFLYDDYDVIPPRAYYYWGLSKNGTQVSPLSLVTMGYAKLAPDPYAPRADIVASDMVYLPVNVTNLTTAGTVSFRLRNLGPDPMTAAEVAFDFRIANNAGGMVLLGTDQRDFTLAPGQEELVILTAQAKRDLVVPPTLLGVKQVQVTVRHASTLIDPNPDNNTTTAAGSVLVRPAGVNSPGRTRTDYDGDGKTDPMVLHADRAWFIYMASGERYIYQNWVATGLPTPQYLPALGDYDGDGVTDLGLYEELTGIFYARLSSSGATVSGPACGGTGYIPVVGDYDGDGKSDPALYNQTTGHWLARLSLHNYAEAATWLHGPASHYMPVHGDYDGDGLTDPASYSTTSGVLVARLSSQNYGEVFLLLGQLGCVGLRGDFDGDGMADPAVYHEASGTWLAMLSNHGQGHVTVQGVFGGPGWISVPNDYDGDGLTDPAIYYNAGLWNPIGRYEGYWRGMFSSLNYAVVEGWFAGPGYESVTE